LQGTGYVNAALPIGDTNWTAFAFGGYQFRDSTSSAFAREPGNVNNVLSIYPNGFLPQINVLSKDLTVTAGVRGQMGEWNATIKASYGRNRLDYRTQGSLNSTYGAASQTSFYDGAMIYDQALGGMDLAKLYKLGGTDLNVAWGVEVRREGYRIIAGEPTSYNRGPQQPQRRCCSDQRRAGLHRLPGGQCSEDQPHQQRDLSGPRSQAAQHLHLGAAVRGEHYSDFGDIATGKLRPAPILPTGSRCAARCRRASARPRCNSSISPRPLRS
jgi:iron complex outermembrane receptor protein